MFCAYLVNDVVLPYLSVNVTVFVGFKVGGWRDAPASGAPLVRLRFESDEFASQFEVVAVVDFPFKMGTLAEESL